VQVGNFQFLWAEPFNNDPSLARDKRKFSYYYLPWADTLTEEIEIKAPSGFESVERMKDINIGSQAADYWFAISQVISASHVLPG